MFRHRNETVTSLVERTVSDEKRHRTRDHFKREKPDFTPVFVKSEKSDKLYRYILHNNTRFSHLLVDFRRREGKVKSSDGLIAVVECGTKSVQVVPSSTVGSMEEYLHEDGFLYVNLMVESVFG